MREASMTWIEEYCFALKTGNLDFFVRFLDMDPSAISEITTFEAAQRFIKNWIADVEQRTSFVTVAQLRTVYTCLNNATISAVKFGKLLARNGLTTTNRRGKGRGFAIEWKLDTYERTQLINEYFSDRDKEAYKCQNVTH